METQMDITTLDQDGALRETADRITNTRAGFVAKAALAAGGIMGGGAVLAALPASAAGLSSTDIDILNFALTLEYLESTFYKQAIQHAGLDGKVMHFAKVVHSHEDTHVSALKKTLGSQAVSKPKFDFGKTVHSKKAFLATSIALEDTGVRAYKGQAPRIQSTAILKAALSIHTIEAKHAAWVRYLADKPPAPVAVEKPRTMAATLAIVKATGFVVGS